MDKFALSVSHSQKPTLIAETPRLRSHGRVVEEVNNVFLGKVVETPV